MSEIVVVGNDAYGPEQIRNLRQAGVDTAQIRMLEGVSTGVAVVSAARRHGLTTLHDPAPAGDCFNAAFSVALGRGESEVAAMDFACAAAAISARRPGAQSSLPRLDEVEAFMASRVAERRMRPAGGLA